jgi:predicted RNA-binding protein associated with RNAse of E/G family
MIPAGRIRAELNIDYFRPPDCHRYWKSLLLDATNDVMVMVVSYSPSKPVHYSGEIVLDTGYKGIWFLFKGQPFDVGRVYRPNGTWTGYYVDILEPVHWEASDPSTLQPIVDLFLDLWIAPDGTCMVLDEDEFEEATSLGHLTSQQASHARSVLGELVSAAKRKEFPPVMVREFICKLSTSQQ